MSYKRGLHSSVLPAVPADADRVPEPYLLQIVKRPKVRVDRKPIARFKLLTPTSQVKLAVMLRPGLCTCRWSSPRCTTYVICCDFETIPVC